MAKCRPPGNRTPLKAETRACRKYLLRELEQVRPRIILLLGATAPSIVGKEGVEKNRGQAFDFNGAKRSWSPSIPPLEVDGADPCSMQIFRSSSDSLGIPHCLD